MPGMKKQGLGRGLDALLDYAGPAEPAGGVLEVDVNLIDNNAQQPRKQFDQDALNELAASIRTHGIVQPLLVKRQGGRYLIVAGERRFRAARIAGLTEVPVIVTDFDDAAMHEVSLIENIQREDLNPIEEAAAIRFLMRQHDMTQEEVSARIGKSRPAVANALRLLQLPERVIELLRAGTISAGHGRAIAGVEGEKLQLQLADETVRLGYSVRALESRIKHLSEKKPEKEKPQPEKRNAEWVAAEESLREKFGTRVRIEGSPKKGRVAIEFYSEEELKRIYEMLYSA